MVSRLCASRAGGTKRDTLLEAMPQDTGWILDHANVGGQTGGIVLDQRAAGVAPWSEQPAQIVEAGEAPVGLFAVEAVVTNWSESARTKGRTGKKRSLDTMLSIDGRIVRIPQDDGKLHAGIPVGGRGPAEIEIKGGTVADLVSKGEEEDTPVRREGGERGRSQQRNQSKAELRGCSLKLTICHHHSRRLESIPFYEAAASRGCARWSRSRRAFRARGLWAGTLS